MANGRLNTLSARDWLEPTARIGYATKGVVYTLIGGLALTAALGSGGRLGGGETAVRTIGQQPFGQALLVLTALGLFAYALWRMVSAVLDPEQRGSGWKAVLRRVALGISGSIYAALGVLAMQLALGNGGGRGNERTYAAAIMSWEGGGVVLGLIAIAVLVFAATQMHRSWTTNFLDRLRAERMTSREREWATRLGRIGLAARGVVLVVIGVGVGRAALSHDPSRVRGVGGALASIARQPFGIVLLAIVATGLVAYGIHQFVQARYRRIPAAPLR